MRALAVSLALHGVAHFVGVGPNLAAATGDDSVELLFGRWQTSDAALLLVLAASWAVIGAAFIATAGLVWLRSPAAQRSVRSVASVSLFACLLFMPVAATGMVINALLLVVVTGPAHGLFDGRRR